MADERDDARRDTEHTGNPQADLERDDRTALGGDAEAAGTVDQREDVADGGDDDLFDDADE